MTKVKPQKTPKSTSKASEPFAAGLNFRKLFFIFLIGSVFGAIYEDIYVYFSTLYATGHGEWMVHRGVIYGPFNVIYGFGAALMCWLLLRKKYSNGQIFLYSALLGGIVEYLLSFFQELVIGTRSWDYSGYFLNFNGRTTLPIMALWGAMGLLLVKVIYPRLSLLIERIPSRVGETIFWVLLIFMIFDMLISWSALFRQTLRHNNVPSKTPIGKFFDAVYPDSRLEKAYPNMERRK